MDERPNVYVVQMAPGHNFSKAERYGNLVPLIQRDAFPDDVDERIPVMAGIMRAKLSKFNPMRDFLLLNGDPIAIALAVMTINRRSLSFQALKWDRENQDYFMANIAVNPN